MALIFCPSCGTQVSDKAEKCIKCGFEIQKRFEQVEHDFSSNKNLKPLERQIKKNKEVSNGKHLEQFIIFCAVAIFIYIIFERRESKNDSNTEQSQNSTGNNSNSTNEESFKNTCTICGKLFTGKGYTEVRDGVWEKCVDLQCPICSQTCGMKHTNKMNGYVNSTRKDLNDGRIYEKNACSMCKGTGLETSYDAFTRRYNSRTCPMCDGKGVRGY